MTNNFFSSTLNKPVFKSHYVLVYGLNDNVHYWTGHDFNFSVGGTKTFLIAKVFDSKEEALMAKKKLNQRMSRSGRDSKVSVYSFTEILKAHFEQVSSHAKHHFFKGVEELDQNLLRIKKQTQTLKQSAVISKEVNQIEQSTTTTIDKKLLKELVREVLLEIFSEAL